MREKPAKDCGSVWCCPGRCDWFKKLYVGVITFFSIAAFAIALISWSNTSFTTSYRTYTVNGVIRTSPAQHILAGTVVQAMTLPNNLVEYVGTEYHIDCASPLPHSVTILPGVLTTTWDGVNRVMTCNAGPVGGAGVSFRVVTPSLIRLVSARNVVFSP